MWNTPPTPDNNATTVNAQKANGKKANISRLDKRYLTVYSYKKRGEPKPSHIVILNLQASLQCPPNC